MNCCISDEDTPTEEEAKKMLLLRSYLTNTALQGNLGYSTKPKVINYVLSLHLNLFFNLMF